MLANSRFRRLGVRQSWKMPAGAAVTSTAAAGAGAADTPPVRKPNPNLKQRPLLALFCLKQDNSCCYAHYSYGNNCNVVVKLVQECKFLKTHFTSILWKQFAANDMFLREANSYMWALALRNSRLIAMLCRCIGESSLFFCRSVCGDGDSLQQSWWGERVSRCHRPGHHPQWVCSFVLSLALFSLAGLTYISLCIAQYL